jgi:glyoxylase-like metal-dependent hydrolase (beta-lactamase superfamily II)
VIGLWLTHGHFDHLADHKVVTDRFPKAKVLIHKLDEPKLKDPTSKLFKLPFEIPARSADGYVEDGQVLAIGGIEVRVMHTPGHSPGHVAFYLPGQRVIIGGDLIMMNSIGRTDLPDSDADELYRSIRKVMRLPDETQLLAGHGEAATLGEQRRRNPYVMEAVGEK